MKLSRHKVLNSYSSVTLYYIFFLGFFEYCSSFKIPSPKAISPYFYNAINQNPFFKIISRSYSFFYWLPRRNLPYDRPFMYFKNSSIDFVSWYQIPHNLPPYRYLVLKLNRFNHFIIFLYPFINDIGRGLPFRFFLFWPTW
jgi:hypothetical protein